jgi:hypothetical protein
LLASYEKIMNVSQLYRIYVASSWRNLHQPTVVAALRGDHHHIDIGQPAKEAA